MEVRAASLAEARFVSARRDSKRGRSLGRESCVRRDVRGWIGAVIGVREENIKDGFTEMRILARAWLSVISVFASTCFASSTRISFMDPC